MPAPVSENNCALFPPSPAVKFPLETTARHTFATALAVGHGPLRGRHRRDQAPAPLVRRPSLRILRRRALLRGLRATPRLGLRRPATAHRAGGETRTPDSWRFA